MDFSISKTSFLEAINIGASMSGKSKILPMHSQAKITINDGDFIVSSYDGEVAITKKVSGVDSLENISFCIEPKDVVSLIKSLRDEIIFFKYENKIFTVLHNKGKAEFPTFSSGDFISPIIDETTTTFKVKAKDLFNSLNAAKEYVANDSLRPILNGVLIYLESGFFGVTATDGVKLFNNYIEHEYQGENVSAVLSGKANNVLLSMINGCDDIEVSFSNSNVVVKTEDSRLVSKKIDGRYPNFKAVIPRNHHTIVRTDKNELIDSLSRVTLIANKTNMCVKVTKSENNIVLEANDYDFSRKSVEKCACESDNNSMIIGAHCGNLIRALRSIESTNVDILLSDNNRPIVLKDELNKNKTIIIMPMLITD